MPTDFEVAKIKTLQKWDEILALVKAVGDAEVICCSFCVYYGGCRVCPAKKLCQSKLAKSIQIMTLSLEKKLKKGISLVQDLEE